MLDVKELNEKIDAGTPVLDALDLYWRGEQPAAFLSPEARSALGKRLDRIAVNFPKLAVESVAERLRLMGFRTPGEDSKPDGELWKVWRKSNMEDGAAQAHVDALVYGRSFIIVWAGPFGVQVTVESPQQMSVIHDPATREVKAAFKRWEVDGVAHGVLYGPDTIHRMTNTANVTNGVFPSTGWTVTEVIKNPLGVVPVVPIVNRGRLMDLDGVSEMQDIMGLSDALNKLMSDSMVSSEFFARPRRWATGLEVEEDEEGNPVDPFSNEAGKLWLSEDENTKFGQFDGARLDGYADLTGVVTSQIGALSGLPPMYLGIHGDQPASADAIRSSEASLVSRAFALQRVFGQAWAQVAQLVIAVRDGVDPRTVDIEAVWASPETRTPTQSADAAVKLKSIGVPTTILLTEVMGYSPAQIERFRDAVRAEAQDATGVVPQIAPKSPEIVPAEPIVEGATA